MHTRRLCTLAFLALLPLAAFAQGRVRYTYDEAGNRVKREAVLPVQKSMARRHPYSPECQMPSGMSPALPISVGPNPTEGPVRIAIPGLKATDKCTLRVYAAQGELIMKADIASDAFDIDISNHPSGIYLLKITVNDNPTTWKVIKK